ncbi:hypothetical protein Vadar_003081 [Vaccinium darrowii]|uniref:Uncharacterized protein n=1 Tax=Vaccinium darrowii TaxID=229202 RepID=A0ACB7YSZ9_9ERIC|nr:hypothetical protein Vadar_003081 [Vaccinium darrowii]
MKSAIRPCLGWYESLPPRRNQLRPASPPRIIVCYVSEVKTFPQILSIEKKHPISISNSLNVNGFNDAPPQCCPLHGNHPRHFLPIIFPPKSGSHITSEAAKKITRLKSNRSLCEYKVKKAKDSRFSEVGGDGDNPNENENQEDYDRDTHPTAAALLVCLGGFEVVSAIGHILGGIDH